MVFTQGGVCYKNVVPRVGQFQRRVDRVWLLVLSSFIGYARPVFPGNDALPVFDPRGLARFSSCPSIKRHYVRDKFRYEQGSYKAVSRACPVDGRIISPPLMSLMYSPTSRA